MVTGNLTRIPHVNETPLTEGKGTKFNHWPESPISAGKLSESTQQVYQDTWRYIMDWMESTWNYKKESMF